MHSNTGDTCAQADGAVQQLSIISNTHAHSLTQATHAPKQMVLFNSPLAVGEQYADIEAPQSLMPPPPHVSINSTLICMHTHTHAQASHAPKQMVLFNNPLAVGEQYADIEAPQSLMPPPPHVSIDRMLKRAANRLGGKVSECVHACMCVHARVA